VDELSKSAPHRIQVLLVEDEDLDTLNTQRALRDQPNVEAVTTARDGEAALEVLRAHRLPTQRLVILLDLRMPRMGGLEFLQRLRLIPELRTLPVVVMTASLDEGDRRAAYALNAAGYFVKSPDRDTLSRYLDSMCAYWSRVAFPRG